MPEPDIERGIKYWEKIDASVDGVLGGFGNGPLPRVDELGSRQFLLFLMPHLSTVPSALRRLDAPEGPPNKRRIRALDVGAGIGRVTSSVLLHLVDDVVLIEPVEKFINEAIARGPRWKGIDKGEKGVTFLRGTLQSFDPSLPISKQLSGIVSCGRLGYAPTSSEDDATFDVIWCQWCLGHLSDSDLISLFKRSRPSLRHMPGRPREGGLIVVKENLCSDGPGDVADTVYDALDASVTRSRKAWLAIFQAAGLKIVREEVQHGLPDGLYEVRMWALR